MPDRKTTKKRKRANLAPAVWYPVFLAELALTGNVLLSARKANIGRATAYEHYHGNAEFKAGWDAAMDDAGDILEAEARRRATRGVTRSKVLFYRGKPIRVQGQVAKEEVTEYSDTLLIFLLKGAKPDKYAERVVHQSDARRRAAQMAAALGLDPDEVLDVARQLAEGGQP